MKFSPVICDLCADVSAEISETPLCPLAFVLLQHVQVSQELFERIHKREESLRTAYLARGQKLLRLRVETCLGFPCPCPHTALASPTIACFWSV